LLIASCGAELQTAIGLSISVIGNSDVLSFTNNNFPVNELPAYIKYGLCFLMIAGRLDVISVLVLFTKDFWKNK
jgi:trk system potassium uptake protein TrkH